ncbi:head maturation protease, ClpP-related [Nonomuraea sp. NPDC050404]|uniref:head maturation protease, ClpP-related n=1 Tax=Nonomuraea sp. NPDC050404 TaxID=3155783 RepID=UPI0033FD3E2A
MSRLLKRPHNFQRSAQARVGRWYELKNLAADVAEVSIYDEIGAWGVTASEFCRDLQGVTARTLELHINSPGGDVWDGLAILNSLRQHPATVNVTIDGLAASAASFIAMAGDTVVMAPQSMFMIHEASGLVIGNSQDMADMAALLDKASANIAQVYAQRAGGDVEDWRAAMRAETWYSDREAVEAGLADAVLGEAEPQAKKPENKAPVPSTDGQDEPTPADPEAEFDLDEFQRLMKEAFSS